MTIRKVADIIIRASPNGRLNVTGSGLKFYSYDKNSVAIDFYIQNQDRTPTDLFNVDVKLMLLTRENNEWKQFTAFDGVEIISGLDGHARYVIPDKLRGYQGIVEGYVYLDFNDDSRSDECYFNFTIERSRIEEEFEHAGEYYIKEIQDTLDETIAELKKYAAEKIKEYEAQLSSLNSKISNTTTLADSLATQTTSIQAKQAEILKLIADNNVATKQDIEVAKQESSANASALIDARNLTNAWSWSVDGTDRFTTVYPRKNIFNHLADYPVNLIWNRELECYEPVISNVAFAMFDLGKVITDLSKTYTMSFEIEALNDTIQFANSVFYLNPADPIRHNKPILIKNKKVKVFATFKLTTNSTMLLHTYYNESPQEAFRIYNVKVEQGDTPTIYTTPPSDDPINAYPTYKGISIVDSDNPADYSWQAEDNTIAKKTDLTKDKVGLGNVDNYSTATQAEAEAGTATNKFMTPLRVFQAIAKWTKEKFVNKTGDETIAGAKNFTSTPLVNSVAVAKSDNVLNLIDPQTALGLKNFKNGIQLNGLNIASEYAKAVDTDKYNQKGAVYLGGNVWIAWETLTFQNTGGYTKGSYIRLGSDSNAAFTYPDVKNTTGGYIWLGGACQPDYTDGGFGAYHITIENNFNDARKPIVRFVDSPTTPVKKLAVRGVALIFAPPPTENSKI